MNSEELMIGDYIRLTNDECVPGNLRGKVVMVAGLRDDDGAIRVYTEIDNEHSLTTYWSDDEDDFEPIPITPAILEKNTSESNKNVFGGMNYALNADYFIETRGDKFCLSRRMAGHKYSTFWVCDIHYVHELRHLLKLVGIDKEIQI